MAVVVTALARGDGGALARLWRDLWILHESWGGYPAAQSDRVYAALAQRIDGWAEEAAGDPVRGAHVHLVARDEDAAPLGQIEGWLERYGESSATPTTCELRSLIVDARARGRGVGTALVRALEALAGRVVRGPSFFVAEVLVQNTAQAFYRGLGYRPIGQHVMLPTTPTASGAEAARVATMMDAWTLARLELLRRQQLQRRGDLRLDPPRALDATFLAHVSRHLTRARDVVDLVTPTAACALSTSLLEPPFAPVVRAVLSRVSASSAGVAALLEAALPMAAARGAPRLEVQDLPLGALDAAFTRRGAAAFSELWGKPAQPR